MSEKRVYSYHTFLYPFLWDKSGTEKIESFAVKLREGWEADDMIRDNQLTAVTKPREWIQDLAKRAEEQRLDYQTFQYFNAAARKALFRADGDIVHSFSYRPAQIHEKAKYRIFHRDLTVRSAPYELDVNYIQLKLFNTGVGILAFELEYPMPEGGCEAARQDIRAINEFGRRIYPEFLPKRLIRDGTFSGNLCASKIELQIGEECLREPIRERAESHLGTKEKIPPRSYLRDPQQKDNFIRRLLFPADSKAEIIPAVDDRMFVCCCIADAEYTERFLSGPIPNQEKKPTDEAKKEEPKDTGEAKKEEKKDTEENQPEQERRWNFLTDWKTGDELYALTNIDLTDGSCQNREMLDRYFEEQLYLRWANWGTIHAVTNHSMFCLTGEPMYVQDSVINPFLVLYVQMAILVLAQRASLISFDAKITNCVSGAQSSETELSGSMLRKLIDLSEAFAIFQGEIMIQEVTSQIQGIELYEKLQKMLFVERLEANIQRQMRNLYEIAQTRQAELQRKQDERQEEKQQRFDNALAIMGVGFTIIALFSAFTDLHDFLMKCFGANAFASQPWFSVVAVLGIVFLAGVITWQIRRIIDRKKQKNR